MKWYEIVFNLLDDPMIECCGMDGLWDEIPNVIIEMENLYGRIVYNERNIR